MSRTNALNKNTLVVNFTGGPGCGKSTQAAELFALLKKEGVSCELICEFAKEKVWDEAFKTMDDQFYLFAKQFHRQWRLRDKVDIIITDSPLMLSLVYNKMTSVHFSNLVVEQFNMFSNMNYFLERAEDYCGVGRNETHDEAVSIDNQLKGIYDMYRIPYQTLKFTDEAGVSAAEQVRNDIRKTVPQFFFKS